MPSLHSCDVPKYDKEQRDWYLHDEKTELYDFNLPDGSKRRCWNVEAKNRRDGTTTKRFVVPDHEPANHEPRPPCRCAAFNCGGGRPHCNACLYTDDAELCGEMRNSDWDNILDEMLCADTTDIMNRVSVELEVKR
ncbi:hypothetical protein ST47_g8373 [Ascochyta rabiei]|uniref:Uncharacterized protein n=1 Tax=Didymella rabiei TaxID=5454 RepID=A0A162ZAU6_DIDRA|nr:hypothetical protein ST47_g8373 [Ascochyta rabiei]